MANMMNIEPSRQHSVDTSRPGDGVASKFQGMMALDSSRSDGAGIGPLNRKMHGYQPLKCKNDA